MNLNTNLNFYEEYNFRKSTIFKSIFKYCDLFVLLNFFRKFVKMNIVPKRPKIAYFAIFSREKLYIIKIISDKLR